MSLVLPGLMLKLSTAYTGKDLLRNEKAKLVKSTDASYSYILF